MHSKNKAREMLLKQYGRFYKRHYSSRGGCYYCGGPSEVLDHVPPLSWIDSRSIVGWKSSGIPLVLVSACRDCNSRLSNKPFFTVEERLKFLESSLEGEYERKATLWSEEEIMEMSPEFQRSIRARKGLLIYLHDRLREVQQQRLNHHEHPEV